MKYTAIAVLVISLLVLTVLEAGAAQRDAASGEPRRSYGSIDVTLYVTSW